MNIKQLIKAILIGIAKIVPGLSGTVLMISFNIYDKAINAITRFFDNPKKNFLFLFNLGIGILIGVVLFSKLIKYCLDNYYIYTMTLFIGLIIGGIITIKKEITNTKGNFILILISFIIMSFISMTNFANVYTIKGTSIDYIVFFISGFLEALGTIVPGVSSTALLMLIGIYPYYINIMSNLLNINYLLSSIRFILPFGLGLFIGVILISLIISYLFRYHKEKTFSIILGLSFSTIITLSLNIISKISNILTVVSCLILLITGFIITNKIN